MASPTARADAHDHGSALRLRRPHARAGEEDEHERGTLDELSASSSSASSSSRNASEPLDKRSPSYILRSGLAGGLAGCAAKTIVGPLDRVKILFQTRNPSFARYPPGPRGVALATRDIYAADGARGLFKGHSATLLRIFPYAAIKFLAYEQVRALLIPRRESETPVRRMLSGSLAGMTSVLCTYPLEVVRVRLAFETKHGARSGLVRICGVIYREGPGAAAAATAAGGAGGGKATFSRGSIANFYRGFLPTVAGMFPYAGMSFLTHDTVGDWLRHPLLQPYTTLPPPPSSSPQKRPQLTASAELLSGALSGLVAQTCSYPLEVVRRRMQVAGAVGDGRRRGVWETARVIAAERGWRGFWVGLTIGYLKIVPMAAAGFYVYERAKWVFGI